jgi:outer membrane protein TolC
MPTQERSYPDPSAGVALDETERAVALSLSDAVQLAVQHNLAIERERFNPRIAQTEVRRERAAFDPAIGLRANISQTKALPTTERINDDGVTFMPIEPFSKDGELTPLLRQRIITGGNYELSFSNARQNIAPTRTGFESRTIVDPRFESRLELSFVQPLLRDFGIAVNTAPIRQAQNNEAIAYHFVVQAILDVVFQVQERYWSLIFRLQDLDARRESQQLAEDFLAENRIRVELGTLAPIELVQAETEVKIREEDVIVAESAVREAEDLLKEVLNIPETLGTWQLRVNPTDSPTFVPVSTLAAEEQVEQALQARPDILASQLDIESRKIARDVARNQRLPRLDLEARGSVGSFEGDAIGAVEDIPDASGYGWLFGLQFEYPLGNRAARNVFRRRDFELRQALVERRELKLAIVREVRQAIRGIETAAKRVEVTRAATKLAQTQLEAEQERFRLGLSTSFRVLEFQRDLTDARSSETQALTDFNIELARLDLSTGTLRYAEPAEAPDSASRAAPDATRPARPQRHSVPPAPSALAPSLRALSVDAKVKRKGVQAQLYTVQVGAYLVEKHAQQAVSELRQKGYEPYTVVEQDAKKRLWRRVCLGRYTSLKEAQAMGAAFEAQENRDALVVRAERLRRDPREGG